MAKNKKRKINFFRLFLLIFILFIVVSVGAGSGFLLGIIKNMPDTNAVEINPAVTSFVFDNDGNQISKIHGTENRIIVPIEDIPVTVQNSFIAAEDHRFREHFGIDVQAFARAVIANIKEGWGAQGASTITVQLANNAFIKSKDKLLKRKVQEYILAVQLERTYTKDEILEFYLNQVYFGEGAFGVQTAALTYFDKEVSELTLEESAMLAGLVQRPSEYNPFKNPDLALKRRNQILDKMYRFGYIHDEKILKEFKNKPLNIIKEKIQVKQKYGYFIDHVIEEVSDILQEKGINPIQIFNGGLKIYTTMDTKLQNKLEKVYEDNNFFPSSNNDTPVQSAAIFIDHRTGKILGMMGGREYTIKRGLNRAVDIKRQPGSTIKPISVYGPAVEKGYMPSTIIDDVPTIFPSTPSPYAPKNYDGRWRGLVTMRTAIQYSINMPAVKTLDMIGIDSGYTFAKKLGLPLLPQDRNLSLALGGITQGISPLDMASAYGAFANQGIRIEPYSVKKIIDSDGNVIAEHTPKSAIVMKEQTAYLVTDMLKTVVQAGTGTRARLNRPVAGKTGTTQLPKTPEFEKIKGRGNKDAWFAGYTPEIVGVVWIGYDKTTTDNYLKREYGGKYPAAIWKAVVSEALKDEPVKEFIRPEGIVYAQIDAKSGKLPSELTPDQFIINEIFTQESLPREISDIWIEGEVCADSGKRPTEYCPNVISGIFLNRIVPYIPPQGYENVYPEDWELTYPQEKCDLHGPDTMLTFKLCIDPRHDSPKLALIPENGQTGGCPNEYVIEKSLPISEAPQEYCDLAEHQLQSSKLHINAEVLQDKNKKDIYAVKLTWNSEENNNFKIYRWSERNKTSKQIGKTNSNKYVDMHVKPNMSYYYQLNWENNNYSNIVQVNIK
jgi:penicillin-binding protein 1A